MTQSEMEAIGYFAMDSPVKGRIYTKQNGDVVYEDRQNKLVLPNGNSIQNPTLQDLTNDYSSLIKFRPLERCGACGK